jgi:hypothetical protein
LDKDEKIVAVIRTEDGVKAIESENVRNDDNKGILKNHLKKKIKILL